MGEGKVKGGVLIEEGHRSWWSPLTWVCSGPSKKADGLYALPIFGRCDALSSAVSLSSGSFIFKYGEAK